MAFLCPVRIKKPKRKGVPPRQLDAPLPGRITGSDSIDTLVRVGLEKERGPRARMVVVHDFIPCVDDELAVKRNQQVQVLYQENDWLYVITEDGKEGFIPYTYCLPVERSVDDFVLPKSKREYLTQSGLTGGHVKSEPETKSNLSRTDSKSMPDITKVEQRQRRQQPVGQAVPSQQDLNRNTVRQNDVKSQQNSHQRSRESTRRQDHQPASQQRSLSTDRYNTSRSRESSRSRGAVESDRQRAESRERLQGGRSRESSRTRDSSRTREASHDRILNRSFSTANHTSNAPHQQQGHYKSAPTTPDWNRHRRESQSPDYYNLLPLDTSKNVEVQNKSIKNSSNVSGYSHDNNQSHSQQRSWHSSGSQPNLNQSHTKSNSSRSSQSSNSPRNNHHQRQHSNSGYGQTSQKYNHTSQERLSHNHRQEGKSTNHKTQGKLQYNHQTYNHTNQEKSTYNLKHQEQSSYNHKSQEQSSYNHKSQDKTSYNHRQQAQFTQNSPFYQPGQSSTLPRNFAAAPSKQNFQRTQSLHESHPSQTRHQNYQHQRQNSLPANYDHTKQGKLAQTHKNHSQSLHNQSQQSLHNQSQPNLHNQSLQSHGSQEAASVFEKRTYGQYIALFSYSPRQENDIGVERGEFVTLLNKDDEDWYWIRKENRHEGFVPKSFLCPAEGQEDVSKRRSSASGTHTFPRHQSAPRPMSPAPVSPPPTFNLDRATKLVCRYDYKASAPDDLSVSRGQWLYADLDHQADPDWLWVYSPVTCKTGYIPRTYAKPPNFGSLSNLNDPFTSP